MNTFINGLYQSIGLGISVYSIKSKSLSFPIKNNKFNKMTSISKTCKFAINQCIRQQKPVICANYLNCVWFAIPAKEKNFDLIYLLGPALLKGVSEKEIKKHLYHQYLSADVFNEIAMLYQQAPVIDYLALFNYYKLVHFMILKKPAALDNFGLTVAELDAASINYLQADITSAQKRGFRSRDFYSAVDAEKFIIECVRKGDVEALNTRKAIPLGMLSSIGPTELRSLKNTIIVAISIISRAAISGGLPVEISYPLSDMYFLQIEAMTEMLDIINIYRTSLVDFTSRVKNSRLKTKYSHVINQCCIYISSNINKSIKVADIAKIAKMTPDGLSRRFKRETGMTAAKYIEHAKINEAKLLLSGSEKSMLEISSLLGYPSQNQLSIAFKRATGYTPTKFKKAYKNSKLY